MIYMLKLKYGDDFATRSGGAWRLIFALALMPWLRRYRLDDDLNHDDDDDDNNEELKYQGANQRLADGGASNNPNFKADAEHVDLQRLRKYVSELEKRMEEKLGEEVAVGILNELAQEVTQ